MNVERMVVPCPRCPSPTVTVALVFLEIVSLLGFSRSLSKRLEVSNSQADKRSIESGSYFTRRESGRSRASTQTCGMAKMRKEISCKLPPTVWVACLRKWRFISLSCAC